MKMLVRIISVILCLFLLITGWDITGSSVAAAYANEEGNNRSIRSGWTENNKYYFYENGEPASGIVVIGKKFYCFNQDGKYLVKKTDKIRKAAKYKKPFANLKKIIGQPDKSKYYASCYGNGKDGVLSYDNFTVYTFKPKKGKEIFMGAE